MRGLIDSRGGVDHGTILDGFANLLPYFPGVEDLLSGADRRPAPRDAPWFFASFTIGRTAVHAVA